MADEKSKNLTGADGPDKDPAQPEAGGSPVCPVLYMPLFLNDSVPEEHKAGIDMRRDLLRAPMCFWSAAGTWTRT